MFGNAFTGWHALIILLVILLLFGAPKLPALARSLGQSMKILKNEVRSDDGDEAADGTAAKADASAQSTTPPASAPTTTPAAPADQAKRTDAGPSA